MERHQYRNLYYKPDMNICDLPAKLVMDLRESLDTGPETKNWRAFLNAASNQYQHYTFRLAIEPSVNNNGKLL